MLTGSAACAAAGKTNKKYRNRANALVVFMNEYRGYGIEKLA